MPAGDSFSMLARPHSLNSMAAGQLTGSPWGKSMESSCSRSRVAYTFWLYSPRCRALASALHRTRVQSVDDL